MSKRTKTPQPSGILPEHLALPSVADELAGVDRAMAAINAASSEVRETRAALEAAPDADQEALRAAVGAGEPTPERSEPARRAEHAAAQRRLNTARALGQETGARLRAALVRHREELNAVQQPRVAEAADRAEAAADVLAEALGDLAREAGIWRGLYATTPKHYASAADERSRMLGRTPAPDLPSFDGGNRLASEAPGRARCATAGPGRGASRASRASPASTRKGGGMTRGGTRRTGALGPPAGVGGGGIQLPAPLPLWTGEGRHLVCEQCRNARVSGGQ